MEDTTSSIASQVALCLASFNTLQEAVGNESRHPNGRSLRIAAADLNGRFRVWLGNIGAHQNGTMKSSLDYRLRDAGYIKIRFIRLLKDLNMLLLDGESCLLEPLSLPSTPDAYRIFGALLPSTLLLSAKNLYTLAAPSASSSRLPSTNRFDYICYFEGLY